MSIRADLEKDLSIGLKNETDLNVAEKIYVMWENVLLSQEWDEEIIIKMAETAHLNTNYKSQHVKEYVEVLIARSKEI